MDQKILKSNLSFLQGGDEMGELTRNFDWENTVLGSPETWPQSLRTTLSIVLNSNFPMSIMWGPELIHFYNDAFRPSLGNNGKHPSTLGQKGEKCRTEIWPNIKPLIDQVFTGEAVCREDQLIPIYRNGRVEDGYWTFSYSPVRDESGKVAGVLIICSETTEKVFNTRKLVENAAELKFAIDSTELGIWDFNPLTNHFKANSRLKSWFGLKEENEIEPLTALEVIDENDRSRVIKAIQKSLESSANGFCDFQFSIYPPGMERKIVRAKGRAWFDDRNILYRFNGTVQDITEQVLTLKKIEDSEQRVRSVIESAPFSIGIYIGEEMRIQFANQSILEVWGKGNDVIGKLYSEVLPELGEQKIYNQLSAVYRTGVPFHAHNQQIDLIVHGKPTRYYFNYSLTPLYSGYEIYGIMNTAADVTDLNTANKKIEESEQNLRNTILHAPVAMCIFRGPKHIVEIANERMVELWGKEAGALIGKPIFEGLPEVSGQGLEALVDKVYNTGETYKAFGIPVTLPRNNRIETAYLDMVYEAFRETPGEISGVIVVATEVTEQVLSRKKIEEAEERTKIAIESAELGNYQVDLVTNETITSARFNTIWGISHFNSREEVASRIHPDDRIIREMAHRESLLTGKLYYEARVIWNDLSIHWIKASGKLLFDENNKPVTLLGVVQDITTQKEIDHQKDAFVATVSHELKTPITSMKVYCYLLLEKFASMKDDQSTAMLSNMNLQINRLNYIIQDLLDVTRIEANKIRFRRDSFNFNELVKEIVDEVQITKQSHQIVINHSETANIYADKERTSQVITNLLTNAIRYSPNADKVIVSTKIMDNYVICCVQDFGSGIEREKQSKIFERFYQVVEVNRSNAGFGLGLYIASQIVQRQNGKIWVESEAGKGSTFYFSLPIGE
ncbi:MAG: PAS domain-containing protein [Ginsengibacter sp.]